MEEEYQCPVIEGAFRCNMSKDDLSRKTLLSTRTFDSKLSPKSATVAWGVVMIDSPRYPQEFDLLTLFGHRYLAQRATKAELRQFRDEYLHLAQAALSELDGLSTTELLARIKQLRALEIVERRLGSRDRGLLRKTLKMSEHIANRLQACYSRTCGGLLKAMVLNNLASLKWETTIVPYRKDHNNTLGAKEAKYLKVHIYRLYRKATLLDPHSPAYWGNLLQATSMLAEHAGANAAPKEETKWATTYNMHFQRLLKASRCPTPARIRNYFEVQNTCDHLRASDCYKAFLIQNHLR